MPGRVLFADALITAIRSHFKESDTTAFSNQDLIESINRCESIMHAFTVDIRSSNFKSSKSYDADGSTTSFDLPDNLYRVIMLQDYWKDEIDILKSRQEFKWYESTQAQINVTTGSIVAIIEGDNLILNTPPGTKTGYMILHFHKRVPWLHQGQISAYAVGTPSVTLDSSNIAAGHFLAIDDIYNDLYIKMTSGSASGETKKITDFVGSTGVAKIGSAFSATPLAADTYSLSSYFPFDAFHMLIEGSIAWLSGGKDEEATVETGFTTKWENWFREMLKDPVYGLRAIMGITEQPETFRDTYSQL